MAKPNVKTIVQYAIFLGLGFFLIWYSVQGLSADEKKQLRDSFSQVKYIFLLPVLGLLLLSHYSRALRWRLLMQPLGYEPSRANTFIAVLIGYFFNLFVPRLGEVMKCTMLARYEKLPPDKLIGTIVAERAFDLVSLMLVTALMLVTQWRVVGASFSQQMAKAFTRAEGGIDVVKIAVVIGGLLAMVLVLRWVFKRFGQAIWLLRVKKALLNILQGLTSIRRLKHPGWFLAHTLFIWACYLVSIYAGFYAFAPVRDTGIGASVSILVFGSLGMIATQGGIGAYQFAVQRTMALYGVSLVAGLSFGWILWGAQTIIVILFGALALMVLPIINRKTPAKA